MAYRVFVSGVSSEFETARDAVADDLQSKGLEVRIQRSFRQETTPSTLLRSLHDYIRDCDAVICIVGSHSGSYPPSTAEFLPNEMLPESLERASITQWELLFARHYKKRLHLYMPEPGWNADRSPDDCNDESQQAAFVTWVESLDLRRTYFDTVDRICREVNKEDWPNLVQAKPINLPFRSLGPLFKGRDSFLHDMRERLRRPGGHVTAVTTRPKAVYGEGGIGKTRSAVEYAWQNEADYNALLFLSAESPESLDASLADLVGVLGIEGMEEARDDVRLQAVFDWLQTHPGWLAILDNVDTEEAVEAVTERLSKLAHGHVLITSRISQWKAGVETLDLDVLEIEHAAEYLREAADQRRKTEDDTEQSERLAVKMGQLPLGLEHAAAYVNAERLTFAEYVKRWKDNEEAILEQFDLTQIEYPRELLVTWKLSVEQLGDDARRLLEILSWFAPEPIPMSIFELLPDDCLEGDWSQSVTALARLSLLRRSWIGEEQYISLHRLVQATSRYHSRHSASMRGEPELNSLDVVLRWIDAAFTGDTQDVRNWPAMDALNEHVQSVTHYAVREAKTLPGHKTARLLGQAGSLSYAKARYRYAEPLMRRALDIDEKSYGPDHPNVAIHLSNLAALLLTTNRLTDAEPLMRRALDIDEKSYGPNHPNVAIHLNNLAQLLQATNRLADAEPLMRRALDIDEKSYGPDHPNVAIRLSNLAALLQDTNRLTDAEPLMRRALDIDEKSYGPDHPNVAIRLSNLAQLLQATDRLADAEPLMRRALDIDEKSYGPDHPNVAIRLSNLAVLLKATNRLTDAEPLMRRALDIDEKSYGPDHPNVAIRLSNLAVLLKATNRLTDAEPLIRRALDIDEKSYGPDHPNVAIRLSNLAQLLQATNRLADAEPLMRRALDIDEKSYGPDHPNVAIRLSNLAALLQDTNRLTDAEPLMRRALDIDEKSYGPDHPNVAIHLSNLAALLLTTNRLTDAEPLMRRALDIDEKSYGPNHPNVAIHLNNLAQLLKATNRLADAEPLMRRALDIDEKSYGPDHPNVAIRLSNLAALLQDTNRLTDAEPLMRRALDIDEKSYGPDHPDVAIRLSNLAQLLQATNRLADAEPLMRRALDIDEKSYGPDHPNVAILLNNLAQLLKATNRLTDAEPLMRRALDIDEKSYGPDHPNVAIRLGNLALMLQATNRLADAEPLMRRALDIDEKSYGPDHPDVAIDLNNLAGLLVATHRLTDAEPLMRRALEITVKFIRRAGHTHASFDGRSERYRSLLEEMKLPADEIEDRISKITRG